MNGLLVYRVAVTAMSEAVALACKACGASIEVTEALTTATCRRCGSAQDIAPELRARALAYRARIRAAWADALESQYHAQLAARGAKKVGPFLIWMAVFVLLIPAWGVVGIFLSPRLPLWGNAALVLLSLAAFGRFLWAFVDVVAPPDVRLLVLSSHGACSSCGAPIAVAEGEVVLRCAFCGMTATPSRETKTALLRAADERLRAEFARAGAAFAIMVRQAGDAEAMVGRAGRGTHVVGWLGRALGIGALMLAGTMVALGLVLDATTRSETGWILPVLLLGAALGVAWAVIAWRRIFAAQRAFEAVLGRPLRVIGGGPRRRA